MLTESLRAVACSRRTSQVGGTYRRAPAPDLPARFPVEVGACWSAKTMHRVRDLMPPFSFRCPDTGFRVQGWTSDDDESERAGVVCEVVTCHACGRLHLVDPKTGTTAGEGSE